jgi:hypothetical protein
MPVGGMAALPHRGEVDGADCLPPLSPLEQLNTLVGQRYTGASQGIVPRATQYFHGVCMCPTKLGQRPIVQTCLPPLHCCMSGHANQFSLHSIEGIAAPTFTGCQAKTKQALSTMIMCKFFGLLVQGPSQHPKATLVPINTVIPKSWPMPFLCPASHLIHSLTHSNLIYDSMWS